MQKPALLVLVRHAESLRNKIKKKNVYLPADTAELFRDLPDQKVPITDHGEWQADLTGPHIRNRFGVFDVVYDSGYLRTFQTRERIVRAYTAEERARMKIRSSHLLRERDPGYTYDMTTEDVDRYFPWFKAYWESFGYFYARPPGGKSQADLCDQVFTFIGSLFALRAGKSVLAITHGGTIRAFRYNLEKWTADDYERHLQDDPSPRNCGVTTYRLNAAGRLQLEDYNAIYWQ